MAWNYARISHDDQLTSKWTLIPYAITFLLGVPGNSAVIWVTGFKMERDVHTMCFLYLAVADLTYCLTLPFWMVNVALRGTWLRIDIPYILLLCSIVFNGKIEPYYGPMTWEMMRVSWSIFIFVDPVEIMTACCASIGWRLHRDKFNKSRKPFCIIMTVVAAFIASWLPLHSCSFAMLFFSYWVMDWNDIAVALACFNSALNPFLYAFCGRDFRRVFRRSLITSLRLAFHEEDPEMQNDTPNQTTSL
ncbi:C3a anaphylatoxin chemotactic receptor-like [Hypanus sabinus]|uniref:C3a anaphylatoxin chemotactic receptor-like n=1 Tax=Hypanus sabinus TaxID=79690 RepID=UPI0028C436A2|nr:C3a anaphylatoxin chemotactic receptor-like [Hypanus sabinus]